jgi:hypothetical protein
LKIKKVFKWLCIAVATPIVLFLLAAVAFYLPPVQQFVKNRVTDYLSEKTGMEISIERVRLAFPLDLSVNRMRAIDHGDTLVAADALRLNVRVKPLLHRVIDISGFELWRSQIDTKSFISDTRIKGHFGLLALTSPSQVDLLKEKVEVNKIRLSKADVQVLLTDTAKKDTTKKEPTRWKIKVGTADISQTRFFVRMPGDSMRIGGFLSEAKIKKGNFNLENGDYRADYLEILESALNYDIPQARYSKGLDTNHLALTGLNLRADTLHYYNGRLSVGIPLFAATEKCGLTVNNLHGLVTLDSTHLTLPVFHLHTPYTELDATANVNWKALRAGKGGLMNFNVKGSVGRHDILLLAGSNARQIVPYYPNSTLRIDANGEGNMDLMKINRLNLLVPGFITLRANGRVGFVMSNRRRYGHLNYYLQTYNLSPYYKMLPQSVRKSVHIPNRMQLTGKINFAGDCYGTNSTLRVGRGSLLLKGQYDVSAEAYQAKVVSRGFPLYVFLPKDSLSALTASVQAAGKGLDFLQTGSRLKAKGTIQRFSYGHIPLDSMRFDALLRGGHAVANVIAQNRMLAANTNLTADILKRRVNATVKGTMEKLNLVYLTNGKDSTVLMAELNVKGTVAPGAKSFGASGELKNINIITSTMGYPADDVLFGFKTSTDSTQGYLKSGDLEARLHSNKPVEQIAERLTKFADQLTKQLQAAHFDDKALARYLPNMDLYMKAGKQNPLFQFMHFRGYDADSLYLDMSAGKDKGLNGHLLLMAFKTGNLLLDKTTVRIYQDSTGVRLESKIENTKKTNPNRFKANLNGEMLTDGFSVKALFKDDQNVEGLNVGVRADLSKNGDMTFHLFPEHSVIAYRKFTVNKDNFFTLGKDKHIRANVDLLADDRTGLKIITPEGDSTRDVTVSLSRVNLDELSGVLPFMPKLGGLLSGDIHAEWKDNDLSAVSQLELQDFRYEECPMGDLEAEVAFLPNGKDKHYIAASVSSKDQQVVRVFGNYINKGEGSLDMKVDLDDFPSYLLDGFMASDGTVGLSGKINGELNIAGPVSKFLVDGNITPDSLHILSPLYGVDLSVENKAVAIKGSKLHMDDLSMYSSTKNPLVVSGDVDFSNLDAIRLNMAFKAKNFEVVSSPQTKQSVVFGHVYSDIDATLKGTTNFMILRGNLKVLDNTNMTYVMKDSPLTVEDRLKGLVEFVDFSDTTHVKKENATPPGGVFVGLNIEVSDAAKLFCELSEDGSSYFNCRGGGNLAMKYFPNGEIFLTGRFSMSEGEMKYALPFIPLKTFNLDGDDNYLSFTGDPYNPTLHITAMEKTRASVSDDNSSTRMVAFNVGVAITQTLNNMGLQFLIEAPEDMYVQNELTSMSKEERGKTAISMLATGIYLSASNKSGFKANNALNAFLQTEIQNIAGNALKTIDLSVGVEGSTSASGNAQTDYSFQFSKHLWNDRVTFKIGGKVTAGSEQVSENQSFIDNISLEYRLGKGTSRNLRLFYDHDTVDPLEGTYATAGGGLVLRKKTNSFGEIFLFRNPRRKEEKVPVTTTNASKN